MRFNLWISNNLAILLLLIPSLLSAQEYASSSALREGKIFKLGIEETGIYELTFDFLQSDLAINMNGLESNMLHIFGHRGGALPEIIKESYEDGLKQFHISLLDGGDGIFDPGDKILFYAEGASIWKYDEKDEIHHKPMNPYDRLNYCFLVLNPNIEPAIIPSFDYLDEPSTFLTTKGLKSHRYEVDKTNLLFPFFAAQGSGQRWFGDRFKGGGEKNYDQIFDIENIPINARIRLFANFAARAESVTSYSISLNGETFSKTLPRTTVSDVEAPYAKDATINAETVLKDTELHIDLEYPGAGPSSDGWLDYIEIHAEQNLVLQNVPLKIINYESIDYPYSRFRISGASDQTQIWDVTIPWEVHRLENKGTDLIEFTSPSNILRTFYAFNPQEINNLPIALGEIENQNLHSIQEASMLVIYHPDFEQAVNRYVEHRSGHSGLTVKACNIQKVYNEFSSGRVDPTAIRDFVRMIHKRDGNLRYLLLFGDATFDYRHIYSDNENHNFVPTYQTYESFDPVGSFPSDDYFTLISDQDGLPSLRGALDISVGRFPVKNADEADKVVDKIIHYETSERLFGNWKLKAGFIADDEDAGMHLDQSEGISGLFSNENSEFNVEKVYFDAFKQEATPGGERYPDVNNQVNNLFNQGSFVINYMGHGGPKGWADEKVLELSDIESWNNYDRLPLCVTATCTFSGYDDPTNVSPGELTFLNNKGGVIGLFSTVRAVYSGSNRRLAQAVFNFIKTPVNGKIPTLGEILQNAKNSNSADTLSPQNARKFLLIGDPALRLRYPENKIITTAIKDFNTGVEIDTLKALQKVIFEGEIQNDKGEILVDFNGTLFPTLYDKPSTIKTLQQNIRSPLREFDVQKNILYNGSVKVESGRFSFSFILPKDINYTFGNGKMSYYATDLKSDASGWSDNMVIGGSADNLLVDDLGPEIRIYLNDRSFMGGDLVEDNPILIVDLKDDSGINVTGNSIGHDLLAIIDQDSKNSIILNEYYKTEIDIDNQGTATYPLSGLTPGKHSIMVKAWDIANNSNEASIHFEVNERPKNIQKVFTYPNPLSEYTNIFFEHGLADLELEIHVEIYNSFGSKVSEIYENVFSDGYIAGPISWDGTNSSGIDLPGGVYYLQISATPKRGTKIEMQSEIHKVIIVK